MTLLYYIIDLSFMQLYRAVNIHWSVNANISSFSSGDLILDGTSTLTLFTSTLQILNQIFEQYLLPRNQNHGFIALSSHPAETSAILQAQFLFDVLQKTLSLKVCPEMWNSVH